MANDFQRKPEITDAIKALRPTSSFSLIANDYSTLMWNDSENAAPSESDVNAKLTELTTSYNAKSYQNVRETKYPSVEEQLDLLYHDMLADKGDKTGDWFAAVKKVKDDNPKP
tara:strand:+ start:140 stop:478 length:339 start_codon:yes stop_codon:yes gene_type:complete